MNKLEQYLTDIDLTEQGGIPRASAAMLRFMELVLKKNEEINLTTITEQGEFIAKHLIDSVVCYGWPEIEAATDIIDVGTGAGFPGVPLAILYPDKHFVLMDSLAKRIDFLRGALAELEIKNVDLVHARAEDLGRDKAYRDHFDLCTSRAVGKLSVLLEYCLPLVRPGGAFYAYKTEGATGEIEDSLSARFLLGAAKEVEIRSANPDAGERTREPSPCSPSPYAHNIMVIKKERPTPKTYPRKPGTPSKVPL